MGKMRIRRVYDDGGAPAAESGFRVLVDRLWPRGVSKERAAVDLWLKEVAPSTELRKAFHHEGAAFDDFARRYRAELEGNPAVQELRQVAAEHAEVVLLFSAKDPAQNQAAVLRDYLYEHPQR
ncbi:DUF488 family protein [Paenarthrobacter sp. Z7-10]|uniref:DUF488 domain-containing protein n=1 Tax=Paenarthrobacter sp. Z7-10 TaxID=2787635 RepID=UPI0022A8E785|nr:DUF488 family protein [Paenarthrobacter sp. Z7-10]MCZ2403949.1 DUF488 family protein [Paenarthrobacter sp. Z7-10]